MKKILIYTTLLLALFILVGCSQEIDIHLLGEESITLKVNTVYHEKGISMPEGYYYEVEGEVDSRIIGDYVLTYYIYSNKGKLVKTLNRAISIIARNQSNDEVTINLVGYTIKIQSNVIKNYEFIIREVEDKYNCNIIVYESYGHIYLDSSVDIVNLYDKYIPILKDDLYELDSLISNSSYTFPDYDLSVGICKNKSYGIRWEPTNEIYYPIIGVNLSLLNEINVVEPAKLYLDDKWSYDEFVDWCIMVQNKLDEKYDPVTNKHYVITGMINRFITDTARSSGISLLSNVNTNFGFFSNQFEDVVNMYKYLYELGCVDPANSPDANSIAWNSGEAVLSWGLSYWVGYYDRWRTDLWGENSAIGYVPFPYSNELSNNSNHMTLAESYLYAMPRSIDNKIEESGRNSSSLTKENIFKVFLELIALIDEYIKDNPNQSNNSTNIFDSDYSNLAHQNIRERVLSDSGFLLVDMLDRHVNSYTSDYSNAIVGYVLGNDEYSDYNQIMNMIRSELIPSIWDIYFN